MDKLPIYAHEEEIVAALAKHQVIVVQGPAGTGKTTQLPRMLMRSGSFDGKMGITQPRRIAAVSVAWRIAEEEGVTVGQEVGYAIRFDDATSPKTRVKVMTDGILLQEARHDPYLSAYDVLMVDEAHERSLNIDFVLGLLHRVLEKRRDLKVIVSSATLHPGKFQAFFRDVAGEVPVIKVLTPTYPVELVYRPVRNLSPDRLVEAGVEHICEILQSHHEGHILAFLPGEGSIVRIRDALVGKSLGPKVAIMPLFGRLTRQEQEAVFADLGPVQKVILSTNIAETSITIENVRFVLDSGLAKIPWFNPHTGVTTLREEPISRASAAQRAGRAGRTAPGVVIRLYSEESLAERDAFTPEEILRVDLSEAVLRLIDLGIRDVVRFAFPTPPPPKKLSAAIASLEAMGAITADRHLTQVGQQMVPFPLSPALARMVVEAATRFPDVASDVLLVGAFLSVRSPFTYPAGFEEEARRAQRRLAHPLGDAVTGVRAYRAWRSQQDRDAYCKRAFLDADTMAFIHKAYTQLCDIAQERGVTVVDKSGDPEHVVRCLATGFAERVLYKRGFTYLTSTGIKIAIHPSSALFNDPPPFAVAAEFVSSGRIYAFNVSALKLEWLHEVNAEAARAWQLTKPKSSAPAAKPEAPSHIDVGDLRLSVQARRRRPVVEIPVDDITKLLHNRKHVESAQLRWRACVMSGSNTLLRGSFAYVLALLPHIPFPDANTPQLPVAVGALLETDRNMHAIEKFIEALGQPVTTRVTPRPGWLTLVSNGGGGYWYDLCDDYTQCIYASIEALVDLRKDSMVSEACLKIIDRVGRQLEDQGNAIEKALLKA